MISRVVFLTRPSRSALCLPCVLCFAVVTLEQQLHYILASALGGSCFGKSCKKCAPIAMLYLWVRPSLRRCKASLRSLVRNCMSSAYGFRLILIFGQDSKHIVAATYLARKPSMFACKGYTQDQKDAQMLRDICGWLNVNAMRAEKVGWGGLALRKFYQARKNVLSVVTRVLYIVM